MSTHLFIPDPHAHPAHDNERFKWLGKLVAAVKPDVVVCAGDWADMPSLCSYDKGTRGFEGRRYKDDVSHTIEAQELFFQEIRKQKKRLPRFVMLEGNHENRIKKAVNADAAKLEGIISLDDLQYSMFGWDVVHYNGNTPGVITIDGIAYAHFFTSGVMGRAISGLHPAYQLLAKQYGSCTQGHTHTTDYCVRTNAQGRDIHGLVGGCYVDYWCDWAGEANNLWWSGVIVKRNVRDGTYSPQWISMEEIEREFK